MHPDNAVCRLPFTPVPPESFTDDNGVAWRPLGPNEARSAALAPLGIQLLKSLILVEPLLLREIRPKFPGAVAFGKMVASGTPSAPGVTLLGGTRALTSPSRLLTRFGGF